MPNQPAESKVLKISAEASKFPYLLYPQNQNGISNLIFHFPGPVHPVFFIFIELITD